MSTAWARANPREVGASAATVSGRRLNVMTGTFTRASALLLTALLLTGCGAPPGVGPMTRVGPTNDTRPPEEKSGQKMLEEITASEQMLGRVLAPARIIRIQWVGAGKRYELRHFDGSTTNGAIGGPGWMVEAVGTFIDDYSSPGQIDALGTHGFHLWSDTGDESFGFIPCWTRQPMPPDQLEGQCEGVG